MVVSPGPSGAGPGLTTGSAASSGTMLATVDLDGTQVALRRARRPDLPALVALLAADDLGATRDGIRGPADRDAYERAFQAIDQDPAQLLLVADVDGRVVGTLQLSFIPGLSRRGALRAQIESVRVAPTMRRRGLGEALFTWSIAEAHRRGCALVQLTTDKTRADAHRFYDRLGFVASHEGLKLDLTGGNGSVSP
ncbi:MAG TPA: GNAT family N-acetyltransferase [Streptosporangiaceae bacterium]|nr:GNAT family N-acetyltransferase [Streptosporangiaceae bacterium]